MLNHMLSGHSSMMIVNYFDFYCSQREVTWGDIFMLAKGANVFEINCNVSWNVTKTKT